MEVMYLLIPLSVVLVFVIGVVFWWSLRSGQFDDMEGPGYRVLMDDDTIVTDRSGAAPPDERRGTGAPVP
jgi:cbb3-type cytochrome oxidase maturation protein